MTFRGFQLQYVTVVHINEAFWDILTHVYTVPGFAVVTGIGIMS